MTDRQAFIDAIRDCPNNDTVRLVYADYLDETGSEEDATLARHIREACEEKGLPEVPPLIEAEELSVHGDLDNVWFEAVVSHREYQVCESARPYPSWRWTCDIKAAGRVVRVHDAWIQLVQDEFIAGQKTRIRGVAPSQLFGVGSNDKDAERDRIRQIRRSVTETRTALLNAFCDKYKLDPSRQEFDKGFVRTLAISLTDLVDNGDAIFAEQPVERVVVTWWDYGRVQTRWSYGEPYGYHEARFDNKLEWFRETWGERNEMTMAERLCRATWPKVKDWEFGRGPLDGRPSGVSGAIVDVSGHSGLSMVVFGDPEVAEPIGIIEVPDDPSNAAPLERRSNSRKNSIPPDPRTRRNPRFPRPR